MGETEKPGRPNQKSRTRKDLLQAAARLTHKGVNPTLEDIAEEALVSRATAYRYFTSVEALLIESALEAHTPEAATLFAEVATDDPVVRVERVDDALDEMMQANEAGLRMMLAHTLQQRARGDAADVPVRQNRRMPLLEAALEPARKQFTPASLETLRRALALVVGTEGHIAARDVLQLDAAATRKLKRWMIRVLIDAARKPPRD